MLDELLLAEDALDELVEADELVLIECEVLLDDDDRLLTLLTDDVLLVLIECEVLLLEDDAVERLDVLEVLRLLLDDLVLSLLLDDSSSSWRPRM